MSRSKLAHIEEIKARNPDRKGDTLEDMEKGDYCNIDDILKDSRVYYFGDLNHVRQFVGVAYQAALRKLGLDIQAIHMMMKSGGLSEAQILNEKLPQYVDKVCAERKIKVECRRQDMYEKPEEKWKAGIYIYKDGEIAFVIFNPQDNRLALDVFKRFSVRTNVRP